MSTDLATFEPWPKTPRLRRDITITEKIDGTNAQVSIRPHDGNPTDEFDWVVLTDDGEYVIKAGSRNRWIRPGADNAGFAAWVRDHANQLVELLGPGRHFGEWWGPGIQGNPLEAVEKTFSLFNTHRWMDGDGIIHPIFGAQARGVNISVVPRLYVGPWTNEIIDHEVEMVGIGSYLNPMRSGEGVIVYHHASQQTFKVLCKNDEIPKGLAAVAA